eukprot:COSAG04_NODE_1192_length_7801_cov_7.001298_5_plen_192_part_00
MILSDEAIRSLRSQGSGGMKGRRGPFPRGSRAAARSRRSSLHQPESCFQQSSLETEEGGVWGLTEALDAAAARLRLADNRRQQRRLALSHTDTLSQRSRHGARISRSLQAKEHTAWMVGLALDRAQEESHSNSQAQRIQQGIRCVALVRARTEPTAPTMPTSFPLLAAKFTLLSVLGPSFDQANSPPTIAT